MPALPSAGMGAGHDRLGVIPPDAPTRASSTDRRDFALVFFCDELRRYAGQKA